VNPSIIEEHTGRLVYEAGLVTTFNAQSVENRLVVYLNNFFYNLLIYSNPNFLIIN
jgi:hypothetical protein